MLVGTACNLPTEAVDSSSPDTGDPAVVTGAGVPIVQIESPANDSQAVVRQPVKVQIAAVDSVGLSRVEMRSGGLIVVSQPVPPDSDNKTFRALLTYTPAFAGSTDLQVVAYRIGGAVSEPAQLTLRVVNTVNELDNPNGLDPTLGVAVGAACSVQVSTDQLNLRTGPDTTFERVTRLPLGEVLNVIGRNVEATWYQVRRSDTTLGWVSAQYVSVTGDCSRAPIVQAG